MPHKKGKSMQAAREKGPSSPRKTAAKPSVFNAGRLMGACLNLECRLRRLGCTGFAGCPGYRSCS